MSKPTSIEGHKWLTYLNSIAIFGLIATIAYSNIQFPSPSFSSPIIFVEKLLKRGGNGTTGAVDDDTWATCPEHHFTSVKHVSRRPEIMIIEGFVTPAEAKFLVDLGEPLLEESTVLSYETNGSVLDKSHRSSKTAYLSAPNDPPLNIDDVVLSCIEHRAASFQGYIPVENLEPLQVVKYTETQEFRAHHDWFHPSGHDSSVLYSGNRLSSFFVYLVADCEGGTTAFTEVKRPKAPEWCEALKCQDENGQEVQWLEVQPKVGTAIFWYNLDPETGDGDFLTMHAGMPVSSGTKIGLNIWTRERSYRNPIIPEEYVEEVEVVEEHIVYVDETGQEYVEVHHE